MKVSELRELLEDTDMINEDSEVRIVEFGYRSSNQSSADGVAICEDDRQSDDWNNEQEPGNHLYILLGGTLGNRYPPHSVREEFGA